MLKEKFKKLGKKLASEIKSYYGERLVSLVVFGSVARETQRFDSDIDILIIAKELPNGRMKRVEEFEIVEDKLEHFLTSLQKYGIYTSITSVIKTPEEAEKGSPLFLDMVEDARILIDKNDFFATILKKFRNRLKVLGAKRIWRGNAWYWVLKSDYKPGEIFELW